MGFREKLLVCATIESETKEEMVKSTEIAKEEGADLVELCMESISHNISDVELVLKQRTLPAIVSFRFKSTIHAANSIICKLHKYTDKPFN